MNLEVKNVQASDGWCVIFTTKLSSQHREQQAGEFIAKRATILLLVKCCSISF
jgi:hypothetical protein